MLHHEISGNGKKPLVLLHGFMENTTIWDEMEAHLSKDFTLIKIDLPGHGKSKVYQEIHTVELMAEKVKEVIDALKLEKINLLGHSLGGYVSLAFAEKFPEILESMTLFFSTTVADDDEKKQIRKRICETGMKQYVKILGKKENPYPYIRACDVYVQPSRYEGNCVAVREAQMLGKPVIITGYPTAESQLRNGIDGIIVPLENRACGEKISEILREPKRLEKLVQECRKKDYSNRQEINKIECICRG